MSATKLASIRRKLLNWYDKHRRDLPWRRTGDPYAIWISETMLQQTQVATVLPYYEKFLRAFPTIEALDRATRERVLRAWSGLGYYRRAENLKKAARQIRRVHGGALPREFGALSQLPGIGEYTAGALMSIAFHQRHAAVDGNVRRVLGRLFALSDPKQLHAIAGALVPRARPGDFNQALMELGATLCTPRDAQCEQCPLSANCAGTSSKRRRLQRMQRKQVKFKDVTWPLAIVRQRGRILLRRRADNGLLARLWELPGGEITAEAEPLPFLRSELKHLERTIKGEKLIGEIRHSITYRRIRAPIYLIDCRASAKLLLSNSHWRWIDPVSLPNHAMSSMTAKALKTILLKGS
jgi:A/G-specific adenine glycosylase